MKQFSQEEEKIRSEIRDVYNSGRCDRALEMSRDFLARFPDSFLAKYSYAVMCGDYAQDIRHSPKEKEELLKIAKQGISELFYDPQLSEYPHKIQKSVKNEYFWFHEMPEDQYKLGVDEIKIEPGGGHYSACVGASMVALKKISNGKILEGEDWARTSLHHFHEFEKIAPTWYNINYFAAQSEACLGHYEEAIHTFKGMYRKQNSETKEDEVIAFEKQVEEIKKYRKD